VAPIYTDVGVVDPTLIPTFEPPTLRSLTFVEASFMATCMPDRVVFEVGCPVMVTLEEVAEFTAFSRTP
jgi:hypothetical protein